MKYKNTIILRIQLFLIETDWTFVLDLILTLKDFIQYLL